MTEIDLFVYAARREHRHDDEFPAGVPADVCRLFERLALNIRDELRYERYSSDAILHRIRWHYQVERGMREFKCNDHWTAVLARWFLKQHPQNPKFFELRERRDD
jgi:hypothetical protein